MNRFCGKIGYANHSVENGVSKDIIVERLYYGDVLKDYRSTEKGLGVNDDINVNNKISVVADPYMLQNFHDIRYVEWMGIKRKVTGVEVEVPRLLISFGGVYHG